MLEYITSFRCFYTISFLTFSCFSVNSGAGSCIDRAIICIGDAVCNSYLAPVLQACRADQCRPGRCQQAAQRFYGSMPGNLAEMLVMCECEASDQSCMSMKSALHGSTCGEETKMCQDTIYDCVEDDNCRYFLPLIRINHCATAAKMTSWPFKLKKSMSCMCCLNCYEGVTLETGLGPNRKWLPLFRSQADICGKTLKRGLNTPMIYHIFQTISRSEV